MKVKGDSADVFRVSVSSGPSTSSHGSAQDYSEAYGDVYLWGEVLFGSSRTNNDINISLYSGRHDILLPKPLESNVLLDIQHVACGAKHAALVTRQGEVFTWGKGPYGLLGYGVEAEAIPRLVESLSDADIEFVACGEFHTCAVSTSGELYTWGDGAHKAGLLGQGTNISHWIPKRVFGPLEGLQVSSVSCGTWHSALITSAGQLFTFGDGTFGTLGHGNRESVLYPREVESLIGLKAIAVSCGVWHTAAVVEVIVTQSSASSGKLFTWGDGDKYRLGHGDKDSRLKPTCVPSLIDYIFYKVACGHSLTIGLTTSGNIFTMGSTVYGQLGNPLSDGKLPCLVQDKLANESVIEVACGSYHVIVLTSKNEVYTWGKGANGRLGHGDLDDRKTPTIVEALKDRPVKHIACGENFTSAVCQHKWVSSTDQSQCTACRQAFGFTRKRHNCYNCGLVHCHSCSSRKFLRAALAPIPGKPYRVCDSCYAKLHRVIHSAKVNDKKSSLPHFIGDSKDNSNKANFKKPEAVSPNKRKAAKQGKKSDALSSIRPQQIAPLSQPRDATFSVGVDVQQANPRLTLLSTIQSPNYSEAGSPFSEKPSPPYSATVITTMSECSFSESIDERLKKTNDLLNQEVQRLRGQVDSLRQRCEIKENELQKSATKVREAMAFAAEELGLWVPPASSDRNNVMDAVCPPAFSGRRSFAAATPS
ncbi:Ultraviolet-B receptor UVR8 [Platanthera zijinensis]|uniref:Ultraviolet-B receptor UVR8 n=1 Tax=Platanthera zijinensis TaxID=2320716 RepID=A0AAP0AZ06_9ASPA